MQKRRTKRVRALVNRLYPSRTVRPVAIAVVWSLGKEVLGVDGQLDATDGDVYFWRGTGALCEVAAHLSLVNGLGTVLAQNLIC